MTDVTATPRTSRLHTLAVLLVTIVVVLVLLFRRGGGFAAIRLPFTVLVVQIVVGVVTLAFSALADK
jgi:hypothetical protein